MGRRQRAGLLYSGVERRHIVVLGGFGAAGLIFGIGPYTDKSLDKVRFRGNPFSLGVASGDPLPGGVVLWTRLAPDPLGGGGMPDRKVPVRWQVALDEGFTKVVRHGTADAVPEFAHSVHIEVTGLAPGRHYYYRFKAGPEISPVGRTKTAPRPERKVAAISFAVASCQHYEHGYYTAYRHMAEEDLDIVLHLGDYIYEGGPDERATPDGNVRHHNGPEVHTLDDYRNRHALYRGDGDLQAAHAALPWVVTWDDHEVENNYANAISERDSDPAKFLRRRAAAYQAYYEHMPLRRSSVPRGPHMRLYRRLTYGSLVEFHVLDTRQYRDDQAAGAGRKPPGRERADPGRTLLGAAQERWLLAGLGAARARWNVLAQQVFFAQWDHRPGGGELYSMESWDGYLASRDRVLGFIEAAAVRNPVVLTGDVHANWANELKADFADPDSPTLGTEFVTTSVASGGDGTDTRKNTDAILAANPHIKFFNGHRGYVRCTATSGQLRADYRVVSYVRTPGAPIVNRASFVVEDGRPELNKAGENRVPDGRMAAGQPDQGRTGA